MQILFHLGAHCTDQGLLIRSILRNRAVLAKEGILVPGPGRYRELLGDVSTSLRGAEANADTETMLLEALSDDESAERIVLSNENFLCRNVVALDAERLYPKAEKAAWLSKCFPSHQVEFAIAVKNPATFVPELLQEIEPDEDRRADLAFDIDVERLVWSDMVRRIRHAVPQARIIVWCHEDSPFLWSEIMAEVTQHDPYMSLDGGLDMIERLLTGDGAARLRTFMESRSDLNEGRRRQAMAAFLDAHADNDRVETEIDLPGWTDALIDELTARYDDDVTTIDQIPGVTFLTP